MATRLEHPDKITPNDARFSDVFHQLDRIDHKLESIFSKLEDIKIISVTTAEAQKTHNENMNDMEDKISEMSKTSAKLKLGVAQIDNDLKPIKFHVSKMNWFVVFLCAIPTMLKIGAAFATIVAAIVGTYYSVR